MDDKIIASPATASGIAAVSMIRVSGSGCIELIDRIFKGKKSLGSKKTHEMAYGQIIDPDTGKLIDEVLAGVFRNPNSFTGEDSLEIWTHGSPYIVSEVMRIIALLGIRIAEPGEFSMRAFLNGKLDLTQAEAVRDLTHAQTKFAHAQAIGRLNGGLTMKIELLHRETLDLLALLEAAIDHAEEELDIRMDQYVEKIDLLINSVEHLLSGAIIGKMSTNGIKTALIGRPNVGKSSLLNALVDEDRVIVSDIAGTTRDVIEHSISVKGLLVRFFDTAGIHETHDVLEKQGTQRSFSVMDNADIIFHIIDQSQPIRQEDLEIMEYLDNLNKHKVILLNKSDLPTQLELSSEYKKINVSAQNKSGLDLIFDEIVRFYHSGGIDPENDILVANVRQESLLIQTKLALMQAKECITQEESEEFSAFHVRKARIFLEEIVGKTTDDAVLDRIFSQFCIGK